MRRYRIVHLTSVSYDGPVRAAHNELRMTPASEPGQTTLENRIRVKPMTWSHVYRDHWGTHTMEMESLAEHTSVEIEAISTVERTTIVRSVEGLTWDDLGDDILRDHQYEYLMQTDRTTPSAELSVLAAQVRHLSDPASAVEVVAERIRAEMTYRRGVTQVHSRGVEAWSERTGVCQDFAHIALGVLRAAGIPARYVSGYLAPRTGLEPGESASGESHAWVEYWNDEWVPVDPTNGAPVELEHVVVARGRDYVDVPPFKGIYSGRANGHLEVVVTITRLA